MSEAATARGRATRWLLLLFAVLLYANTVGHDFVHDDVPIVLDNPLIRELGDIPTLFVSDYWEPSDRTGLYRPLVTTTYALDYAVWGDHPAGYHAVNIALHGLVCVLVLFFYRRLTDDDTVAALAAFLFAALAVHTEVVANVIGRAELLAAAGLLGSFLLLLRAREAEGGFATALRLGAWAAFAAGLLSKESAVTTIGVVALYDGVCGADGRPYGTMRRADVSQLVRRRWDYAGYLAVVALYLVARVAVLDGLTTKAPDPIDNALVTLDPFFRIVTALQISVHYLWLQLVPVQLSYDYSANQIALLDTFAAPGVWAVLGGCAAALALAWRLRHSRRALLVAGFYVVTFSVVANVFTVIGTILGERLVYTPSIAVCLGFVLLLRRVARHFLGVEAARRALVAAGVIAIALNGARTLARTPQWADQTTLYLHDVDVVPNSSKANNNAGTVLQDVGRHEEALPYFSRAAAISPDDPMAYVNAAWSLVAQGRNGQAIDLLDGPVRRGLRISSLLNGLGYLLVEEGRDPERGLRLLREANEKRPGDPEILDSLGWALYRTGDLEAAGAALRRSLAIDDANDSAPVRRAHLAEVEAALLRSK